MKCVFSHWSVTSPRPVVLAFGWLHWSYASLLHGQYSNPKANTTALGPVTGSIWKHPFNSIIIRIPTLFLSYGDIVNASIRPSVSPFVRPSVCTSRYLLLNNWAEVYQTCYITYPHSKGVQEQNYFSVRPSSVHLSVSLNPPKPLGGMQPNLLHHFPSWLECARATLFFRVSVRPCVRRPSIYLSRYLLLKHWAEFNQTCYIISPHCKGVREQHFFRASVVRPSVRHAISLMVRVCESNIIFRTSVVLLMSFTLSPPKPLGGIQPNLLHYFPSW